MRIDIDAFNVLQVLVEEGSFAKAAERLHKAQSAVSYQVKKLEEHLGVQLFSRDQYRAELTSEGRVILAEGQRLLQHLANIEHLASRFSEGWEPKLELVIDGALPMEPIMTALKRMAEHQIPTKIQLNMEFLGGVQHRFERDNADLMLVKDYRTGPYYHPQPLPAITSVLVASALHPLASLKRISLSELQQHVELTIEDSSPNKSYRDELQFGGDKVFYLSGFIMKKNALLKGLGFGWLPDFLVQEELLSGELVEIDFVGGSRYTFTPQLVSTLERPLGRAGKLFTELILEEFAKAEQFSGVGLG
ncbi:LysR family transcriptional regulator [Shewanella oneidensis MR-1]|uniref:Homogentisate-responsive transcriptional repressor of homogenetisate degradation HmgR n=1 Tax=Shewanella oneidensis (strain ATCC 700550 / JCM 31522 / CIP 106686 / LMG 19005 / NCIMB 14063 / MR-1) TaxID=211586 RepID=Q8EFK6_SHEON|nr:LysR family transcriptional regulator [Shewanella oneidensis]AAN55016.1 homogentisate-responsive transcriptional repressor of homogenetisate degradation HmgR [Shewanella oneidensis MR-1]MDX5996277.1 LysR family transcriptional regulator [Shewanella oneidensis]MEE2029646.1 HTH-type transcriptional regulator YhaJ [Shewanella oneidensis]QKG96607.1 LysR family transcriptional regulator [Shewanella oneidensis MR-1]